MRELTYLGPRRVAWRSVPEPTLGGALQALVRPVIAARCDGDNLPIFNRVTTALRAGATLLNAYGFWASIDPMRLASASDNLPDAWRAVATVIAEWDDAPQAFTTPATKVIVWRVEFSATRASGAGVAETRAGAAHSR